MTQQHKTEAMAWDQPFFCRKWLRNRTNGYRISQNNATGQKSTMNEELKQAGDIAKDPATFSILAYAAMMALSIWGGIVRVIKDLTLQEKSLKHIACIFIAEAIVSGFAGTITFAMCIAGNITLAHTVVLTSVSGYMGGRSLSFFEAIYKAWKVRP